MKKKTKNKICNICDGRGYTKNNKKKKIELCKCIEKKCVCKNINNNYYFDDKTHVLKECICKPYRLKIWKIENYYKNANIPKRYEWKFFGDFDIFQNDKPSPSLKKLSDLISKVVEKFDVEKPQKGLLLWSPTTGNGKTLACSIILNTLIFEHCITGKFIKLSSDYFGKLRNSFNKKSNDNAADIINKLINYDVLLIDDFGTEKGTEWEKEKLYELIDGRNSNFKLTLITTNHNLNDIDELATYNRVFSRIIEMCKIHYVKADCYRLKSKEII